MTAKQLRHEERLVTRRKKQIRDICDADMRWNRITMQRVPKKLTLAKAVEYMELAEKHGMWV